MQTLATQFWVYQTDLSYSQAAPYAGVIVLIAAVPSYVLGRWFDRLPARTASVQAPGLVGPGSPGTGASQRPWHRAQW